MKKVIIRWTMPYDAEEYRETTEIVDEEALAREFQAANTMKTCFFNDVQIVKDGLLIMEVRNRSAELLDYLNGRINEF